MSPWVNPHDELHSAAVEQANRLQGVLVTTEHVLVELGNRLARSGDKEVFVELIRRMEGDPRVIIVPARSLFVPAGFRTAGQSIG